MTTSQRSESMNAVTKMFMDNHTSVCKLVIQFEKVVSSRYNKEDEADFRSRDGESSLWSHNPIEVQARSVYTKRVFSEFKNQFRCTTGYDLTELENNCYKISTIQHSTLPAQGINSFIVTSSPSMEKVNCSCKFFEFSGLLCSHALKVMLHVRMHEIPSHYIIKRWTKDAKKGSSSINFPSMLTGDSSNAKGARLNALTLKIQQLLFEASKTFENYEMTCEKIEKLVDENIKLYESLKEKQDQSENIVEHHTASIFSQSSSVGFVKLKDPPQSQCKGKRKPQRYKPSAENAVKKARTCQHCKKKGHNIRTCRELLSGGKRS
ncbi:protein FAR-RED ELONGATED HYPOCOTYL 3-like isoform X1 [Ananas comosus]|uniref:Protein FAR1-RELATED SEQUENCE n=1 Tax=Ananas comosus TaxID=4615 RepID=A0A6P5H3G1_ANACO|nr:protein FAR-RED ELONGATED HYPOCOTYL 3-like isoform X1 [Ananas comosus]